MRNGRKHLTRVGGRLLVPVLALLTSVIGSVVLAVPVSAISTPPVPVGFIDTVVGGAGAPQALQTAMQPTGVAQDGSDVLMSDANGFLRRIDPSTHVQTVVASSTTPLKDVGRAADGTIYYQRVDDVLTGNQIISIAPDLTTHVVVNVSTADITGMGVADNGDLYYGYTNGPTHVVLVRHPDGTTGSVISGGVIARDMAATSDGSLYFIQNEQVKLRTSLGVISVVAGSGLTAYNGDGIPAISAGMAPEGVDVVGTDLYIADRGNNRVRRVDLVTGLISTVAGDGTNADGGDGGPATLASLAAPSRVERTTGGEIHIATSTHVRTIAVDQTILTTAGNGRATFSGDGGPATQAMFVDPRDVSANGDGSAMVADTGNQRVRMVAEDGTTSTVAGNGTAGFSGDGGPALDAALNFPAGVARAANGDVYVADTQNNRVRKVAGGTITTVAGTGVGGFNGDGPATAAQLNGPADVALDANGDVLIADTQNGRVRRLSGGVLTTIAGNGASSGPIGDGGPAIDGRLSFPRGVAVDGADVLIADTSNQRVRQVRDGTIATVAGQGSCAPPLGDGGPATSAALCEPTGIVRASGRLFISAGPFDDPRLRVVGTDQNIDTLAGGHGKGSAGDGGPSTAAQLWRPAGVALDNDGGVLVASGGQNRVRKVKTPSVPSAPLAPNATAGDREISVSWSAPVSDGGSPVVAYTVTATPGGATCSWSSGPLTCVVTGLTNGVAYTFTVTASSVLGSGPPSVATGPITPAHRGPRYVALSPTRILDTRDGTGGYDTPFHGLLARKVDATGGAVPDDAIAVVLTVTAVFPTSVSHVTVWPHGSPKPDTSNLNIRPGDVIANTVVATVGSEDAIDVVNNEGDVNVAIDVTGFYVTTPAGAVYTALEPARIVDSRTGLGGYATAWTGGADRSVQITGGGIPADATAVVLTVTAIGPTHPTHLTLYPSGEARPGTSNLNVRAGETRANTVIATIGTSGQIQVFNNQGEVNVAIDITGYYAAG